MKHSLFIALCCIAALLPLNQQAQTPVCCKATDAFASLASSEKFKKAHPDPLPFHYVSPNGKAVSIPVKGGKNANLFEIRADKPTNNYLLVIHEWFGLNDYIKREAESLQKELGVHVLAVDLYDGLVAATSEEAAKLMKAAKEARIRAILEATLNHAGKNARIQTIGWCFGGGWSLQASIMAGNRGTGCVMYYGMPEEDVNKLKQLKAPVLGIFAVKDEWITPDIVSRFLKNMKMNNKDVMLQSFTADHGFANPSNPNYNKDVAGEAEKLTLKFLKDHVK